jgi:uncharacterized membrane protein YbhN (UPF0104 family)
MKRGQDPVVASRNTDPVEDPYRPDGSPSSPAVSTRTILLGILLVIVLAVGLVLLLGKLAGYRAVLDALGRASPPWLLTCLVLEVTAFTGYVMSLRGVIAHAGGPLLRPVSSLRLWLATVGGTRIVSPAGAGGMAIMFWLLRRAGLGARDSAARVLGFNILIFAVFGGWAWATALIIALSFGQSAPLGLTLPWLIGVPIIGAAAFWVSQGPRGVRLSSDTGRGWIRKALAGAVAGLMFARSVLGPPRPDARAFLGAIVYWAADVACLWAALNAVGADVTLHGVGLAYATAYIAMLLPLPTGGYGAIDAAATFALTVLGVPLAEAVVGVVVWRVFNFWLPTLPGLIELARAQRLGRRLAEENGQPYAGAGPGADG